MPRPLTGRLPRTSPGPLDHLYADEATRPTLPDWHPQGVNGGNPVTIVPPPAPAPPPAVDPRGVPV